MEKAELSSRCDLSLEKEVTFVLDDNNKFVAYLHEAVKDLILPSGGTLIWYPSGCEPVELVNDYEYSLCDAFRDLYIELKIIFRGGREYFPPNPEGIGYEWNQILAHDPRAPVDRKKNIRNKQLWSSRTGFDTWLYTQKGKIFLEITPFYAWTPETMAAEEDDTLEAFRERMLAYKPIAKFVMSRDVAQRWYEQSKELVSIIYKNFERDGGFYVDIETELEIPEE